MSWYLCKGHRGHSPLGETVFGFWITCCVCQLVPWCPPPPPGTVAQVMERGQYDRGLPRESAGEGSD